MNQEIIQTAIDFKRKIIGAFQSITPEDISFKLSNTDLIITIKIDGEYNLLYFDGETSTLINSGGNIKTDLPILTEITSSLNSKEQIETLCKEYIEKDIKKGWNLVE